MSAGDRRERAITQRRPSATAVAITALLAVTLALPIGAGAADPKVDRTARQHFRQGEAYYTEGRFADALAEYQAGYDAEPLPGFLVNIAQCQRRRGDLRAARTTYQKFVLVAPDSPLVPEVQKLIAEVDRLLAESEAANAETAQSAASQPNNENASTEPAATAGGGAMPGGTRRSPEPALPRGERQGSVLDNGPTTPATSENPPASRNRKWWLMGGAVAVAAGAAATFFLLRSPEPNTIHDGSLGALRR